MGLKKKKVQKAVGQHDFSAPKSFLNVRIIWRFVSMYSLDN